MSNLFKRETLSGEFLQINAYLVRELQARGLWTEPVIAAIKRNEGSVQDIEEIPADIRSIYRTAWELPMRALIDMAAGRGAYIDQSQSLNLFMESPTIGKLSSMYLHAWKQGLKTTYYLRSRPATRINKTSGARHHRRRRRPVAAACRPPRCPRRPTTGGRRRGRRRGRAGSRRSTPTRRPSPARWRTPSPATPASDGRSRRHTAPASLTTTAHRTPTHEGRHDDGTAPRTPHWPTTPRSPAAPTEPST